MRLADRLEHDERLEALLGQLQRRHPAAVDPAALQDAAHIAARRCGCQTAPCLCGTNVIQYSMHGLRHGSCAAPGLVVTVPKGRQGPGP